MRSSIEFTCALGCLLTTLTGCTGMRLAKRATPARPDYVADLPIDLSVGEVFIEVGVSGSDRRLTMLLDTGASWTALSSAVARELGLRRRGSVPAIDASGKLRFHPVAVIDSLELGGAVFRDVGAFTVDLGPISGLFCRSVDGVLGANVLHQGVLELDYRNRRARLAGSAAALPPLRDAKVAALGSNWIPRVDLDVGDGRRTRFLIDTGAGHSIQVTPETMRRFGAKPMAVANGVQGFGLHGAIVERSSLFAWPSNPSSALDWTGAEATTGRANMLGNALLAAYTVRIDYPARRVMLARNGEPLPQASVGAGFGWDPRDQPASVLFVYEPSAAYRGGLRVGDGLVSIDGVELSSLSASDRCHLARDTGGAQPRRVRAQRGGESFDVRL